MSMDGESREIATLTQGHEVSVRGSAAVLAQNVQISGGSFTSAGRDVHNHIHYHEAAKVDLKSVLEAIDNFRQIQQDTLSKATPKTGEWVFELEQFPIWRDPDSSLKVILGYGIPGAGKTVLTSIVIDAARKSAIAVGPSICICYFYIRYSDNQGLTVRDVLEVFVKQTVEEHPDCLKLTEETYAEHIRLKTRPTEAEMLGLLQRFASIMRATFYFLDALDETSPQTQLDLVKKLSSVNNVKLFITSRPSNLLETLVPDAYCFTIAAQDRDIELHINKEIDSSPELRKILELEGQALRTEFVASVKQRCGGMFLHASLQLDALRECTNIHDIRETLDTFPVRIEDVYLLTWERIVNQTPRKSSMAQTCLLWVLNAARSMTVDELRHAMATSLETFKFEKSRLVDKDTLVSICRGLLVVDEETKLVRLVHYTAKDTLNRLILEASPHLPLQLTALCINRLTEHGLQRWSSGHLRDVTKADPLLTYAYLSWSTHARNSLQDPSTAAQVENFVKGCQAFPIPNGDWIVTLLGPLHVAAFFDLPIRLAGSTRGLNPLSPNPRTTNGDSETPLHLACRRHSHNALKDLLSLRFIDVNAADRFGWTPLIYASQYGNEEATKLLLAHPEIKVDLEDREGLTPLIWAAKKGHEGISKLLIAASQYEVHSVGKDGRTPLIWAASTGNSALVKLLLATSQDEVDLADERGYTPLIWASKEGHEGTVKTLLEASAKVEQGDRGGRTPLIWASAEGHKDVVDVLIAASQAGVHLVDNYGHTPLSWAAREGREDVVELLLAASQAEVHSVDNNGRTPLIWASSTGKTDVVTRLLAASKDEIHVADASGRTPLIWAAKGGHESAVKVLLGASQAEISLADSDGRTPLMWAASEGHEALVELFLDASEVDIHSVDKEGRSSLILASTRGHKAVVQLLLAKSPDLINMADGSGLTPLSHACRTPGNTNMVELLLPLSQAVVNMTDNEGRAPLILATMQPRTYGNMGQFPNDPVLTVSALLSDPKIDVNLVDGDGASALIWASKQGHPRTVKILLDHPTTDVNLADNNGRTALSWASKKGHEYVVDLLRADPRMKPGLGRRLGKKLDSAVISMQGLWKR